MWSQLANYSLDWELVWYHLLLLGVAYLLAIPLGFNRERHSRSAGLRTFPLVALANCGFMLIGIEVFDSTDAEARVMQGIIAGMGFIGGGAILRNKEYIAGTATAASLWCTGAIGIAVAWRRFEIALVISVVTLFTLQLLPALKAAIGARNIDSDDQP